MSEAFEKLMAELNPSDAQPVNFFLPTLTISEVPAKGFLCLNMIVKNESKIIELVIFFRFLYFF